MGELMEIMPAPDFPTGGIILGRAGAYKAYHTGRGSVILRARTHLEELRKDRWAIVHYVRELQKAPMLYADAPAAPAKDSTAAVDSSATGENETTEQTQ